MVKIWFSIDAPPVHKFGDDIWFWCKTYDELEAFLKIAQKNVAMYSAYAKDSLVQRQYNKSRELYKMADNWDVTTVDVYLGPTHREMADEFKEEMHKRGIDNIRLVFHGRGEKQPS
jgi:hypothetical protein